jgi:hypothetical protein
MTLEPRFCVNAYSMFIDQNLKFFCACIEEGFSASLCIAHEEKP